jgi:hypothetical protein
MNICEISWNKWNIFVKSSVVVRSYEICTADISVVDISRDPVNGVAELIDTLPITVYTADIRTQTIE